MLVLVTEAEIAGASNLHFFSWLGLVYKLGCKAVMKVRGDDTLEGARSLLHFLRQIFSFSRHFLETLTETGSIHWVDVQTWLQSSHEGKRWWHPRGGSFVCAVLESNLLVFVPLFENTYRDGFYTLDRCIIHFWKANGMQWWVVHDILGSLGGH